METMKIERAAPMPSTRAPSAAKGTRVVRTSTKPSFKNSDEENDGSDASKSGSCSEEDGDDEMESLKNKILEVNAAIKKDAIDSLNGLKKKQTKAQRECIFRRCP
jgi:hypothetical protein